MRITELELEILLLKKERKEQGRKDNQIINDLRQKVSVLEREREKLINGMHALKATLDTACVTLVKTTKKIMGEYSVAKDVKFTIKDQIEDRPSIIDEVLSAGIKLEEG